MDTLGDRFWSIIDGTVNRDQTAQLEALEAALRALSQDELVAFQNDFWRAQNAAYDWGLWAAGYIINWGCSDDGFIDFRSWLIAQGKAVYDAAMADPESLAEHIWEDYAEFEEFAYVAIEIYEESSEDSMPPAKEKHPDITGEEWSEDDLPTLYPRLTARVAELES